MKNEGGFLSLEQFQDKYGIISNFLEYNGLLKAIPMKFKEVIAVNNKLEKVCDRYVTVLNNTLKPTKPFYKMMVQKHNVHPAKSQEKWQIRLEKESVKEDWHIIYSIPFTTLISTKLQAFQHKMNLRILFTNEKLMKCNLSETEMCSFCFETRESLVHLFSTALMSDLFGFRLHIAYKQSVILTLLYHQKSVYLVYSLVNISIY